MDIMSDNDKIIHSTLRKHLEYYRDVFTAKTFKLFTWIIVAFIAVDEIRSIKFVWDIFLRTHAPFCLNSVYYFLAYSPLSIELLIAKTAGVVLSLVPERLEKLPVFLIIDDTLQPKLGQHFTGYQEFFDHCKRTGNNYLKGNNFVCIVLSVPLPFREEIRWLLLPVGLWLYTSTLTKLEIARKLIEIVFGVLGENRKAIILCDSWYTKGTVLEAVKSHENLQIIAGVRSDTAIFGLPPVNNGKVGRPRKYGQQLTLRELAYEKIGDYYQFSGNLMTRLFGMPVEIIVTVKDIDAFDSVRMFISTVPSHWDLQQLLDQQIQEKTGSNALILYEHRWDIEIIFYELKFFWSFGNYRVRTETACSGI